MAYGDYQKEFVAYLLGTLPETERATLEEQYFQNPAAFAQLVECENELIDDYLRHRLPAQTRTQFIAHYLAHPQRRQRVAAAKALLSQIEDLAPASAFVAHETNTAPSWWQRLLSAVQMPTLAWAGGAAAVLLTVLSGWLWWQTRQLQHEGSSVQVAQQVPPRSAADATATPAASASPVNAELAQTQTAQQTSQPAPGLVTVLLSSVGRRGRTAGTVTPVQLPAAVQWVQLRLQTDALDYQRYELTLQAAGGNVVWRQADVKPQTAKELATFAVKVPAEKLASGDYVLTLKGIESSGEIDDLSKSLLRVARK